MSGLGSCRQRSDGACNERAIVAFAFPGESLRPTCARHLANLLTAANGLDLPLDVRLEADGSLSARAQFLGAQEPPK